MGKVLIVTALLSALAIRSNYVAPLTLSLQDSLGSCTPDTEMLQEIKELQKEARAIFRELVREFRKGNSEERNELGEEYSEYSNEFQSEWNEIFFERECFPPSQPPPPLEDFPIRNWPK